MKQLLFACVLILAFTSCGSSKRTTSHKEPSITKTDRVIQQAEAFSGTRYKFGGTTSKGMDCSGLIYVAFQKEDIALPRVSRDMAKKGALVKKGAIQKGDLVFFRTNKNSRNINHVGLVTNVSSSDIYFIHATTSRGVLTSTLNENYWRQAFVEARRVL